MRLSTQSLARASSRHPGRTIGLWVLGIIVSGVLIGSLMGSATTTEADFTNTPEAKEAEHLLEDRLRGPQRDREIYVVSSDSQTVDSPDFQAYVGRLKSRIEGLGPEIVQGVQSFYDTEDASLVSTDRRTTILPTLLTADIQDAVDDAPELRQVIDETREPGFRTQLFGTAALNEDLNKVAEEDLRSGESIGLMAALIILVVVFGAVVAALLPVGIAI
ncbi:MAG TPA: MMPL family transporter, partial [Acidimicrobiales bacterium]|nr:MMPL family transporter [Acidimicrobiales bacterium]